MTARHASLVGGDLRTLPGRWVSLTAGFLFFLYAILACTVAGFVTLMAMDQWWRSDRLFFAVWIVLFAVLALWCVANGAWLIGRRTGHISSILALALMALMLAPFLTMALVNAQMYRLAPVEYAILAAVGVAPIVNFVLIGALVGDRKRVRTHDVTAFAQPVMAAHSAPHFADDTPPPN